MNLLQTFLAQHPGTALAVVGTAADLAALRQQYPEATLPGRFDPVGDQTGTDLLSAADLAVQGCRGIVLCRQMIAYRQEFSALRTLCDERGMKLWTAGGADPEETAVPVILLVEGRLAEVELV